MNIKSILNSSQIFNLFEKIIGGHRGYSSFSKEFVQIKNKESILDVGCGTGNLYPYLKDASYLGFDPNSKYILDAKKRYPQGEFLNTDVANFLKIERQRKFDKIVIYGVLHHLSNHAIEDITQLIKERLGPQGSFYSIDPVLCENQSALARFVVKNDRGQFVRTKDEYLSLFRDHFDVEATIRHDYINLPTSLCLIRGQLK